MTGEAHDRVRIADFLERLRHDYECFLVDVDDPARAIRGLRAALPRLHPVIGIVVVSGLLARFSIHGFVGGG